MKHRQFDSLPITPPPPHYSFHQLRHTQSHLMVMIFWEETVSLHFDLYISISHKGVAFSFAFKIVWHAGIQGVIS